MESGNDSDSQIKILPSRNSAEVLANLGHRSEGFLGSEIDGHGIFFLLKILDLAQLACDPLTGIPAPAVEFSK